MLLPNIPGKPKLNFIRFALVLAGIFLVSTGKAQTSFTDEADNSAPLLASKTVYLNGKLSSKSYYDTNGKVVFALRYYTEELLPPFILSEVKKNYTGKSIACVTEVSSEEGIRYHIVLEDGKKWYMLDSDSSGNMHLGKKYLKG